MFSKKLLVTLIILTGQVHADEQVRAVQEELRRRNIYFGDIDGRPSAELEKATKRYQKGKGFSAAGDGERDTLRSLGLVPRSPNEEPPKELEWPQEPILKSDTKIDVVAVAQQIATDTGVSPESIAPPITEPAAGEQKTTTAEKSKATRSAAAVKRAPAPAPAQARSTSRRNVKFSRVDQLLEPEEIAKFVNGYLKAMRKNDVREELEYYADKVSYYANGTVDRRIIESNLKRYYQRWPSRKYSVDRVVTIQRYPERGEIVVNFRVKFSLKNRGRIVRGITDNRLTINAATADPRIVAIEESRVRYQ
jgi:hypothetical protein